MNLKILNNRSNAFPGFICLAVCIIIFLFGLWPLNFYPKNEVEWLKDRNGIRFYGRGIAYTPDKLDISKQNVLQNSSVSIDIWLQPKRDIYRYIPHIISFYNEKNSDNLMIGQWKSNLIIRSGDIYSNNRNDFQEIVKGDALQKNKARFITITSNKKGTSIYINGEFAQDYPNYFINDIDLSGQLILGSSSTGKYSWTGNLYGLAIYNRLLTNIQVQENYQMWKQNNLQSVLEKSPAVIYVFDEHDGDLAHNLIDKQHPLLIPKTFHVLHKTILTLPWSDFRLNLSYFTDLIINVTGFIPFGFFFSLYLLNTKQFSMRRTYIIIVILGAGISLTIELLQVYLPTRSSSLTDLISNILGTILGVIIFHRGLMFLDHHRQVK